MKSDSELDDFAHRFLECSISKEEWTHEAHLAVGLLHVERYGSEEALQRLRVGIRRLNEHHGTPNSTSDGYHETVTSAYVQLLSSFSERNADKQLSDRLEHLLASMLSDRDFQLTFYSPSRLMSAKARMGWVEPDLAPIALEHPDV